MLRGAGGLVVAFALPRAAKASARTVANDSVDAYLAVAPDGGVSVFAGKVDLGTGARAAIRQIVAEELGVAPEGIALIEGDTALTPDQGSTGGSTGIMVGGVQIRQAAATARARLLELAAAALGHPASELDTRQGAVMVRGGNAAVKFEALIGGAAFDLTVDKSAPLRDPDQYTIVGTSYPRPDLPAKLTARHIYVQDHRVDGMWHARVIRAPAIGAKLLDVDASSLAGIPQAKLVRIGDFLAVATPREWDAVRAMRALKTRWSEAASLPGSDNVFEAVRATPLARTEMLRNVGDAATALSTAPRVIQASYAWPIQSHASMGPSCAVADIRDSGGTVWTASQGTHRLRATIAKLLGLDAAKLRLIYMDGSGSYGTNGNDDAAFEAALLSRELGRPVRVQWMREDEHGWDPKGPPQLLDVRATLNADGDIAAWETVAMVPANSPNQPTVPLIAAVAAGLDDGARVFCRADISQRRPALRDRERTRRDQVAGDDAAAAVEFAGAGQDRQRLRRREFLRRDRGGDRRRSARLPAAPTARTARPRSAGARRHDDELDATRRRQGPQNRHASQDAERPRHRLCALQASRELRRHGHGCHRRAFDRHRAGDPRRLCA